MNFFKATFSDLKLPDLLSLPAREEDHRDALPAAVAADAETLSSPQAAEPQNLPPPSQTEKEDKYEEEVIWSGIGLGSFVKSFTQKSEEILQTYRRDLAEFSSGLKKETESIAGAVKEIPNSLEVGATVAQGSLETLGQAIEDIGSTVWKGTAEILYVVDGAATSDGREASEASDPETLTVNPAVVAKPYSRFEAQVLALQQDSRTYCEEPPEYTPSSFSFSLDERKEQIGDLLSENVFMQELFSRLVPDSVDEETFWRRYFFRMHKLELAEAARANLVKRAIDAEEEEDFSWESDEEVEAKREESAGSVSAAVESNASAEIKPEIKAEIKAEDKPEIKAEIKPELKAEIKPELKAEIKPEIIPEGKPENKAEINAENLTLPAHEEDDDLGWEVADGVDETPANNPIKPLSSLDREEVRRKITVSAEDEELGWDLDDDEEEGLKP